MKTFNEFVNKKNLEGITHLELIRDALKKDGSDVGDHLKEDDPYLYVHNKNNKLSFDGVRVYKIGDLMAYRIQKEEKTHPYGKAYLLDVESMFNEFLEDMEEKEAGERVIEEISNEFKNFFKKCAKLEKDFFKDAGGLGQIIIKSTGTDYSNTVHRK